MLQPRFFAKGAVTGMSFSRCCFFERRELFVGGLKGRKVGWLHEKTMPSVSSHTRPFCERAWNSFSSPRRPSSAWNVRLRDGLPSVGVLCVGGRVR